MEQVIQNNLNHWKELFDGCRGCAIIADQVLIELEKNGVPPAPGSTEAFKIIADVALSLSDSIS